MTFIDGTVTLEILAHETPSPEAVRHVVKALIGIAIGPEPITGPDRQNAQLIAEAIGLVPPTLNPDATYRDPFTGSKRKRTRA